MLRLILLTIRLFVDNNWNDGEEWFTYLFNQANLLGLDPMQLQEIAVSTRDDHVAINKIRQIQWSQSR